MDVGIFYGPIIEISSSPHASVAQAWLQSLSSLARKPAASSRNHLGRQRKWDVLSGKMVKIFGKTWGNPGKWEKNVENGWKMGKNLREKIENMSGKNMTK